MVRDLALYLESYSADEVQIDSIASLRAFNNSDMDTRAPYGQGLVDMMDALEFSAAELGSLADDLQSGARAALQQLFNESNLDVLLSIKRIKQRNLKSEFQELSSQATSEERLKARLEHRRKQKELVDLFENPSVT